MRWLVAQVCLVLAGCSAPSNDEGGGVAGQGGGSAASAGTGGSAGSSSSSSGGANAGSGGAAGSSAGASTSGGSAGTSSIAGSSGTAGSAAGGSFSGCDGTQNAGGAPDPGEVPALTPGVWKNITPDWLDVSTTFGTAHIEIDPTNPNVLYAPADERGLLKSTDRGSTWTTLGDPDAPYDYGYSAKYLDSPILIRIDPCDPLHMYATQGVRGKTLGFWITTDGGENWSMPAGFQTAASTINTRDMTQMSVDPTDFRHVIVGSHSAWKDLPNAGLLETTDGGETFIIHQPKPSWSSGSLGVHFLFNPGLGLGDSSTWMISSDGDGVWRTTNAGDDWTQVSTYGAPHGGNSIYYTSDGTLYAGANQYPIRSTDNGVTWTQLTTGLAYATYYSIQGDGNTLYTLKSFACGDCNYDVPFLTSPESDGATWTAYQGGAQTFDNGPFTIRFDPVNRILYSANWRAGLWALRVVDP